MTAKQQPPVQQPVMAFIPQGGIFSGNVFWNYYAAEVQPQQVQQPIAPVQQNAHKSPGVGR